ncbi:MAG: hypothetical protein Q8941_03230 [Bacteroidota bacterium]|nr:hypothetical protein [Bacteroidota bacterium]
MNKLLLVLLPLVACTLLQAQDTLPKFSVKNIGNRHIVIDWVNKFETVKQISIQRSFDSLKNFKTILTVADPAAQLNGYADTKADNDRLFYRLYILLDKGVYLFSDTKRPAWDTVVNIKRMTGIPDKQPAVQFPVINGDSSSTGPLISTNKPKAEGWTPSKFVYTFKDGYIRISLPEGEDKKYSIKFFTMNDQPLFELKDIKEKNFKIDKTDFYHSGWFKFELYEDGKLKEKNKFFLPKEF